MCVCVCVPVCVCVCVCVCVQGMDPEFLKELLGYLRLQRTQLDESRHLLENLERQKRKEGVTSRVAIETSQSGTIPSSSAAGGGLDGARERPRGKGASGVDLKSLYNHRESSLSHSLHSPISNEGVNMGSLL